MKIFKFILLLISSVFLNACDNTGGEVMNFDRQAMLTNYAASIIVPGYQIYQQEVASLETAVSAFSATPDVANLTAVREAFQDAYLSWQRISFYEFGPAMDQLLRTSTNSFPADFITINNNIASADYNLKALSNNDAKGLPAIDYLLYGIAEGETAILDEFVNNESTGQYLADVVADMKIRIDAVVAEWTSGGYSEDFINRDGTDVGSGLSMLINTYNQHFERFTRDAKVGIPLGIRSSGIPIPNNVEALYSGISLQLALANVRAIYQMYKGQSSTVSQDGIGIHDYLEELDVQFNGSTLSKEIDQRFSTAIELIEKIPAPLQTAVIASKTEVEAAYNVLQVLVVLNKVDAASAMGVTINYADNDGD